MDLCGALFCEVNPIPVKAALEMVGWKNASALRLPLSPMAPANADKLRDELAKMGLLS